VADNDISFGTNKNGIGESKCSDAQAVMTRPLGLMTSPDAVSCAALPPEVGRCGPSREAADRVAVVHSPLSAHEDP